MGQITGFCCAKEDNNVEYQPLRPKVKRTLQGDQQFDRIRNASVANFAIVSDIDGVLTQSGKQLGRNDHVINQLLSSSVCNKAPIYFASNNGGFTEDEYAQKVNQRMDSRCEIEGRQVILSHTPFREQAMRDQFKNKVILMTSRSDEQAMDLMEQYGYTPEDGIQIITLKEYACLYSSPQITWIIDMPEMQDYFQDPVDGQAFGPPFPPQFDTVKPYLRKLQTELMVRFNFARAATLNKASEAKFEETLEAFKNQLQINAVFLMVEVLNWNNAKQIICDLMASKDGMPFKKDNTRTVEKNANGDIISVEPQFVKVYQMGTDFTYPSGFPPAPPSADGSAPARMPVPRYGIGAFVHALKELYQHYYGYQAELSVYGKPSLQHMKYMEDYVLKCHKGVKTIYMIGDNLETDILGGNTISQHNERQEQDKPKWVTVAVKTGVFQDSEKDQFDIKKDEMLKPSHIVYDFEAAIKLIQHLEKEEILN